MAFLVQHCVPTWPTCRQEPSPTHDHQQLAPTGILLRVEVVSSQDSLFKWAAIITSFSSEFCSLALLSVKKCLLLAVLNVFCHFASLEDSGFKYYDRGIKNISKPAFFILCVISHISILSTLFPFSELKKSHIVIFPDREVFPIP